MSGKERSNLFCHHANRGGRKHTDTKRKLEIAEGVVNITQCNVTTWSEHAKHYIFASDFDAALISETHLEREELVTAAKEARKFSWAGTRSAAISTANNGTSAEVLALVRTRWFSKPLSLCTDETEVLCTNPRLAGRVMRVVGREILLYTACFEHSVGFRSDINARVGFLNLVYMYRRSWSSVHQPKIGGEGDSGHGEGDFAAHSLFCTFCVISQRESCQFDARCVFSRVTESFHSFWERISISRQACGKTCPCMVAASGYESWEHQWSLQRKPHIRAVLAGVKRLTSSIISWCQHSSDL